MARITGVRSYRSHADTVNDEYTKIGGIPFYIQKEVLEQTTTYYKNWLKAKLSVEELLIIHKDGIINSSSVNTQSYEKQIKKSDYSLLDPIKLKIISAGLIKDESILVGLIYDYAAIPTIADTSNITPERVGNTVSNKWVVNEDERYYLNAPLPWFGSGNLTQEINPNGTLAKVVSAPDTKLAEGISELIPLKEYLTGKYVNPLSEVSDQELAAQMANFELQPEGLRDLSIDELRHVTEKVYKVTLSIEDTGYIYTFTKIHEDHKTISSHLPFDTVNGNYTRSVIAAKKPESKSKKDDNKIGITGSINFPEGWASQGVKSEK